LSLHAQSLAAYIGAKHPTFVIQQSIHYNQNSEMDKLMNTTRTTLVSLAVLSSMSAMSAFSAASAQAVYLPATASTEPAKDAFYTSPSAAVLASKNPGDVLRYRTIPLGSYKSFTGAGYQLMYRTTNNDGAPSASVTTILIPDSVPATGRKLMSYQSMYDSLTLTCSPSYLTVQGKLFEESYLDSILKAGVIVVMSDYEGLQSQWIAGKNTAHGVLDGIRAAIKFNKTGLDNSTPVGMMGFSGGGHATGWAAEMAAEYAPELNIVGAAMGGIPPNVASVAKKVDGGMFASVYFGAVVGLARAYPAIDTNKYATTAGLAMIKDMGNRCLLGMFEGQSDMLIKYAFQKGTKYFKDANFLQLPVIADVIKDSNMGTRIPSMPVFIYQGSNDEIMPIADVDALVKTYCAAGVSVQYNRTSGDHLLMAIAPTPMRNFVMDRLNGKVAPTNCN
jgi:pimeloyl-ACP methyl ester carboxylesterase